MIVPTSSPTSTSVVGYVGVTDSRFILSVKRRHSISDTPASSSQESVMRYSENGLIAGRKKSLRVLVSK